MDNSMDEESLSSIFPPEKRFSIPLMNKHHNYIEKYVHAYKKDPLKLNSLLRHDRVGSLLSSNASRMVYGGKFTPDYQFTSIDDDKSYVKHSPLKDESTEDRLEILDKI